MFKNRIQLTVNYPLFWEIITQIISILLNPNLYLDLTESKLFKTSLMRRFVNDHTRLIIKEITIISKAINSKVSKLFI